MSSTQEFEDFIEKSIKKKSFRTIISRKIKSLKDNKEIRNFISAAEKIPNENFRNRIIKRLNNQIKKRPADEELPDQPEKKVFAIEDQDEEPEEQKEQEPQIEQEQDQEQPVEQSEEQPIEQTEQNETEPPTEEQPIEESKEPITNLNIEDEKKELNEDLPSKIEVVEVSTDANISGINEEGETIIHNEPIKITDTVPKDPEEKGTFQEQLEDGTIEEQPTEQNENLEQDTEPIKIDSDLEKLAQEALKNADKAIEETLQFVPSLSEIDMELDQGDGSEITFYIDHTIYEERDEDFEIEDEEILPTVDDEELPTAEETEEIEETKEQDPEELPTRELTLLEEEKFRKGERERREKEEKQQQRKLKQEKALEEKEIEKERQVKKETRRVEERQKLDQLKKQSKFLSIQAKTDRQFIKVVGELKNKFVERIAKSEIGLVQDIIDRNHERIFKELAGVPSTKRYLYPSVRDRDTFNLVLYDRDADGNIKVNTTTGAPIIREMTSVNRDDSEKLKRQRAIVDMTDLPSPYFPIHGKPCRKFFSNNEFSYLGRRTVGGGNIRKGHPNVTFDKLQKLVSEIGSAVEISSPKSNPKDMAGMYKEFVELTTLKESYSFFTVQTDYNYNIIKKETTDESELEPDDTLSVPELFRQINMGDILRAVAENKRQLEQQLISPSEIQSKPQSVPGQVPQGGIPRQQGPEQTPLDSSLQKATQEQPEQGQDEETNQEEEQTQEQQSTKEETKEEFGLFTPFKQEDPEPRVIPRTFRYSSAFLGGGFGGVEQESDSLIDDITFNKL